MGVENQKLRMTMSGLYLMAQIDILAELGFSQERSFLALNIPPEGLSNLNKRLSIDSILPLYEIAAKALNNPLLGLEVGFRFRIGNFTQTGALYGYCKNLLQVIEMNQRYQRLAIDIADIKSEASKTPDGKDRHCMHFIPYYDDHKRYRHITDLVMGSYGTTYRWLSWSSGEDLQAVYLPYDAPQDTSLYERVFQCDTIFNAPHAAIQFRPAMMTEPLTTHDPEKLARTVAQLDEILGTMNSQLSLEIAIKEAMRAALLEGTVSSPIIAERLGRPERQFRTDMKSAGLIYRTLIDTVRQDLFVELNKRGESFVSIAQSLGYNDQAAFNRAFKRWYGVPPGKWQGDFNRIEA